MQTDETIINKLAELLRVEKIDSSFDKGKITYNGNSFELPNSSTNNGKRTTNLKYR